MSQESSEIGTVWPIFFTRSSVEMNYIPKSYFKCMYIVACQRGGSPTNHPGLRAATKIFKKKQTVHLTRFLIRQGEPGSLARHNMLPSNMCVWHCFFFQADFVFVVISPQYKVDADRSTDFAEKEDLSYHGLHTRYIHRLMQTEYVKNACKNFRFVPLIFHSSGANRDHVPEWLQNTLMYRYYVFFSSYRFYFF